MLILTVPVDRNLRSLATLREMQVVGAPVSMIPHPLNGSLPSGDSGFAIVTRTTIPSGRFRLSGLVRRVNSRSGSPDTRRKFQNGWNKDNRVFRTVDVADEEIAFESFYSAVDGFIVVVICAEYLLSLEDQELIWMPFGQNLMVLDEIFPFDLENVRHRNPPNASAHRSVAIIARLATAVNMSSCI